MTIEYKRVAKARKKKIRMTIITAVAVVFAMIVAAWFICTVRHVEIVGNKNYSAQQIKDEVLTSVFDYNTIYLHYQNKYKTVDVPLFLDMVEIEIVSYNSIRIHAYEKEIMGYVEYMGNYVYFDKDGMVLETSAKLKENLPVVKGLEFDKIVVYEKLPVKDQEIFGTLVTLTQMLEKNKLAPDCIEFTIAGEIDMTFGEVIVHLGKDEHMDNKIARLTGILPQLEGRSGILFMEDVDETTQRITFKKTKSKAQLEEEQRLKEEEAAAQSQEEDWEEYESEDWEDSAEESWDEESGDDSSEESWDEESGDDSSEESWDDSSSDDSSEENWDDSSGDDSSSDDSSDENWDEGSQE